MKINRVQLAAIRYFAGQHGRFWKRRLSSMWWAGSDQWAPNGALLRQVRNELGPEWLSKFRLDGDHSTDAENQDQAKLIAERVAILVGASISDWERGAAKQWIYSTFKVEGTEFRIGVSTGGVISINGSPHTTDTKRVITNNHLFEMTLLSKLETMTV